MPSAEEYSVLSNSMGDDHYSYDFCVAAALRTGMVEGVLRIAIVEGKWVAGNSFEAALQHCRSHD